MTTKTLPLLFLLTTIFLSRPAMLTGYFMNATSIFPRWELGLLAGCFLILQWEQLILTMKSVSKSDLTCLLILLASGLVHFFRNDYYTQESLGLNLIFLTVPLFACINKTGFLKLLPYAMSFLWVVSGIAYLLQIMRGSAGVGITGNWNWNSTFLLASAPFVIFLVFHHFRDWFGKTNCYLLSVAVTIATLLQLYTEMVSRAAIITLLLTGFLYFCITLRPEKRRRLLLVSGVLFVIGILLLTTLFKAKLDGFIAREIRASIYESTVRLILDHPFGTGAESFEEKYIPYKSADYFMNAHASPRTIHPHNEFLNLAALLGIPALLAWCFLTFKGLFLFVRRYKGTSTVMKLSFFSFCVMLIHSMLDLILFSWPQDIIGFTFAGLFWAPLMYASEPRTRFHIIPKLIGSLMLCAVLLGALNNFRATLSFENSLSASRKGDAMNAQKYARSGAALSLSFPEQLYMCIERAVLFDKNYPLGLELAEKMEKTPYRNMSRLHMLKATALVMLGRDEEATEEYKRDSLNYPLLILPRIGAITCYGRLGNTEKLASTQKALEKVILFRGLTQADVRKIMNHPECDLNQNKLTEFK